MLKVVLKLELWISAKVSAGNEAFSASVILMVQSLLKVRPPPPRLGMVRWSRRSRVARSIMV